MWIPRSQIVKRENESNYQIISYCFVELRKAYDKVFEVSDGTHINITFVKATEWIKLKMKYKGVKTQNKVGNMLQEEFNCYEEAYYHLHFLKCVSQNYKTMAQ